MLNLGCDNAQNPKEVLEIGGGVLCTFHLGVYGQLQIKVRTPHKYSCGQVDVWVAGSFRKYHYFVELARFSA